VQRRRHAALDERRADPVGALQQRGEAAADGDAEPAQSSISRSFSPSPKAAVRTAVNPSRSATTAMPAAFDTPGAASSR
jgi:hypothetical protein